MKGVIHPMGPGRHLVLDKQDRIPVGEITWAPTGWALWDERGTSEPKHVCTLTLLSDIRAQARAYFRDTS